MLFINDILLKKLILKIVNLKVYLKCLKLIQSKKSLLEAKFKTC